MISDSLQSSKILSSHNRSKTLQKLSKICLTQTAENKDSFDPYTSFIYRDSITRNRYEMSNLKRMKNSKSKCKNQEHLEKLNQIGQNDKYQYFSEELNFLKNIRQYRNQHLLTEFIKLRKQKNEISNNQKKSIITRPLLSGTNNKANISKIKKRIQTQVMLLNQQFLREYLYHQQPFNKKLLQINRNSDSKIIDEQHINKLKKNIFECLEQKKTRENKRKYKLCHNKENINSQEYCKNSDKSKDSSKWKNLVGSYNQRQIEKQKIRKQIDQNFSKIWTNMKQQISYKVRFQGEYNWIPKQSATKRLKVI